MAENKHYIKVFYTDEGSVINLDGETTFVSVTEEELSRSIGDDICSEMREDLGKLECGIYGYRIDYTLTPIKTDPFA